MYNILRLGHILAIGAMHSRHLIPKGFVVLITLITVLIDGFKQGWGVGLETLLKVILAAELVIRNNTELAIANDPTYTFFALLQIINALMILYFLTKFIARGILVGMTGSQAPVMAWLVAIAIVGILELAAVRVIDGYYFIPLWDGIIFMAWNIIPVLTNINWFSLKAPVQPSIVELTEAMNSTLVTD